MNFREKFEYNSIQNLEDEQQFLAIIAQCFGVIPTEAPTFINYLGRENCHFLRYNKQIIAGLGIYPMGQWYGGKCVPMGGIAAVGVAPEYRGTGAAYELMSQTIQKLHQSRIPLSALYPATQVLYRKVGYEQGGSYCRWQLPLNNLQFPNNFLPIGTVNPINYEVFENIYNQKAQENNGNLKRHISQWQRLIKPPENQSIYAYIFGDENKPEGYIIFTQKREPDGFILTIKDWVLLTEKATERFWSFLATHRSQINQVRWWGSPVDPILLLLPEQTAKIIEQQYWMLRVVDVPLALSQRGYPQGIETELHLEIKDDLIAANNGKFCLQVAQGKGEIIPGGKGDFQINIRGLASLYTGLFNPIQLQLMGYLQASSDSLARATLIFNSSHPWMPDFF